MPWSTAATAVGEDDGTGVISKWFMAGIGTHAIMLGL